MLTELFLGGMGDAIITDVVNAALLTARGQGHTAMRMDHLGGPMPNSVYYTTRERLEHDEERAVRFCRALQRGMDLIRAHPAAELSDVLQRHWPDLDQQVLIEVVDDLRATDLWASVVIDRGAYDTWQEILAGEHLVDAPIAYDALVASGPARAATAGRDSV